MHRDALFDASGKYNVWMTGVKVALSMRNKTVIEPHWYHRLISSEQGQLYILCRRTRVYT